MAFIKDNKTLRVFAMVTFPLLLSDTRGLLSSLHNENLEGILEGNLIHCCNSKAMSSEVFVSWTSPQSPDINQLLFKYSYQFLAPLVGFRFQ